MSLASLAEAIRKDLSTPGVPTIIEMAILSTNRQVLYSNLSKAVIDKVLPFYRNALDMNSGDNMSLSFDPTRTIVLTRFSKKAVLVVLTDKVAIILTRTKNTSDKFGSFLDESIESEEARHNVEFPTLEIMAERISSAPPPVPVKVSSSPPPAPVKVSPPSPPPLAPPVPTKVSSPAPPVPVKASVPTISSPRIEPPISTPPPTLTQPTLVSISATDIVNQAKIVIDEARKSGVAIRALGSAGVAIHCPSASQVTLSRRIERMELVADASRANEIENMLVKLGFALGESRAAPRGVTTMEFFDDRSHVGIKIFLDNSEIFGKIDPTNELGLFKYTVPVTNLLLAELQIAEISEDDIRDIMAIVLDHEVGKGDPEKIDMEYIGELSSRDPNLWKSLSENCQKIVKFVDSNSFPDIDWKKVESKIGDLLRECRFARQTSSR